jgi:hypothetical protein
LENLNQYRNNIFSQAGEDGILEYLIERPHIENRWCVEFGAWDGIHLSNTRNLIINHGWSAVMIEGDKEKFIKLENEYKANPSVHTLCKMVGGDNDDPNRLDAVLRETPLPKEFDLLSIDVDGNDWYIWNTLKEYTAKIVIIEANSSIPPEMSRVNPVNSGNGASARALLELATIKGYELVAHTGNCIFVKKELYPSVGLKNNDLFCLFDRSHLKKSLGKRILLMLGLVK